MTGADQLGSGGWTKQALVCVVWTKADILYFRRDTICCVTGRKVSFCFVGRSSPLYLSNIY